MPLSGPAAASVYDAVDVRRSLTVAARVNGTVNGAAVDTVGFATVLAVAVLGTLTDGSHAFVLEDSDDGSTGWATCRNVQGTAPASTSAASDDDKTLEWGAISTRRFVRISCTTSGATTGGVIGGLVILGSPRRIPVVHSTA